MTWLTRECKYCDCPARSYVITLQQLVIATYLTLFLTGLESLLVFTITDWHRRKIKCGACTFSRCATQTSCPFCGSTQPDKCYTCNRRSADIWPVPGMRSVTTPSAGGGQS